MSTITSVWATELSTQIRPRLPTRTVTRVGHGLAGAEVDVRGVRRRHRAAREDREEAAAARTGRRHVEGDGRGVGRDVGDAVADAGHLDPADLAGRQRLAATGVDQAQRRDGVEAAADRGAGGRRRGRVAAAVVGVHVRTEAEACRGGAAAARDGALTVGAGRRCHLGVDGCLQPGCELRSAGAGAGDDRIGREAAVVGAAAVEAGAGGVEVADGHLRVGAGVRLRQAGVDGVVLVELQGRDAGVRGAQVQHHHLLDAGLGLELVHDQVEVLVERREVRDRIARAVRRGRCSRSPAPRCHRAGRCWP